MEVSLRKFLGKCALATSGLFVPRIMDSQVIALPYFVADSACNLATNSATTAWLARLSNTPPQQTIDAHNCLMNTLDAAGLTSNILAMNTIDTTSLSNALKPTLQGGHAVDWTNHNFVSGDLNSNGLKGDGTTKYIQPSNFGSDYASSANAGFSIYVQSAGTSIARDCGYGNDTGNDALQVISNLTGTCLGSLWSNNVNIVGTSASGWYSVNRTATNVCKMYFGNSTTTFAQVGSTDTSEAGALGNHEIYVCGFNHWVSGNPIDAGLSNSRISFWVQHNGLSLSDATKLFNAVQKFLTNRGGGYV